MKRYILFILIAFAAMYGCKKETIKPYNSADNIYLGYKDSGAVVFTFAYNPSIQQDTIWVPVKISGIRVAHDRSFALSVLKQGTTAVSDLHYVPLKPSYIMPADSGTTLVPVIIKNIDTALASKTVSLTIRVTGGKDFGSSLPDSNRTKTITFSNRLEEPSWWTFWGQLGAYSRTKHQLFLISSGTIDLADPSVPDFYLYIPRDLYYIQNFVDFLDDPFTWVAQNPDKGYVLTKRADNTGDYDFYNQNAPAKKFHLKYYGSNKYIFLDENGVQISL